MSSQIRVCVCVPHGGAVHPELYRGLFQMQNALGSKGYLFAYTEVDMASVAKARNMSVIACIEQGYDYVHFVDNDVIVPENIAQLYETDADIISGLYFARQWPHTPQMYTEAEQEQWKGKYWPVLDYSEGIMEVDAVGAGCLLIKVSVLRKMREIWEDKLRRAADFLSGYKDLQQVAVPVNGAWNVPGAGIFFTALGMKLSPWFEFTDERGEDFYFCERARQAGFRILVDTRVKCKHLTWMPLEEAHYQKLRESGVVKFQELEGEKEEK